MRRKFPTMLVLLLAVMLVSAVPATAAEEPVGPRVNLFSEDPCELPANSPFFVIHGWGFVPSETVAIGRADFSLDVDGLDQGPGKFMNFASHGSVTRLWLYNFEEGLPPGDYVLTGHWTLPCEQAVTWELVPGPCELPNEPVEAITGSVNVHVT